jgi:MFS family permease
MTGQIAQDRRTRLRLLVVLFAASGINRTAYIAAITVTALASEDMLGAAKWSGLAAAFATMGIAAGTPPISALMSRMGRRIGYVAALGIALIGSLVAIFAIELQSFPLFLAGLFLFGSGMSGERLGRYAAADVAPPHRRASAISSIVFAGTIGAVLGPLLLEPSERVAESVGWNGLSGGFIVAATFVGLAFVVLFALLRPDPLEFAEVPSTNVHIPPVSLRDLLARPIVLYGLVSLAVGQAVMVMIMAMTPVHIRAAGEGLAIVGLVISAHTFGMFFFSPVTGWLVDRFGALRVILTGQLTLVVSAVIAAPAGGDQLVLLLSALFLLGLGWNLGFVGGSALINEATDGAARLRLQGLADAITWMSGAAAGVSSGLILDASGYRELAIVGGLLVSLPLLSRLRVRRPVAAAA